MNIKFRKGTYRAALVVGPVTFKFIFPGSFFFGNIFRLLGEKFYFKHLKISWKAYRFRCVRGLFANITEFFTWKTTKATFLAPTYFSCGFLNIQKTIKGESADCFLLVSDLLNSLPQRRRSIWLCVEGHSLYNSGWIKTNSGIVLFDYGDTFGIGVPISNLFLNDKKELELFFSQQKFKTSQEQS